METCEITQSGTGRRLIVNADGFGFGAGATQGILDAIAEGGFISSVSVSANFPEVARLSELVRRFPEVSVGVHLNPMVGRPCLSPMEVPSLVNKNGYFHEGRFLRLLYAGNILSGELEAELEAQIACVKQIAGERVTHLDSQANSHLHYFDLFLRLARKWKLRRMRNNASLVCLESATPQRARLRAYMRKPHVCLMHWYRRKQMRRAQAAGMQMADRLVTVGYSGDGNKSLFKNWERILRNLPNGTYEIYCHPAYPDDTLRRWSYYCDERERELDILKNRNLRQLARDAGVEVVSFDAI